MIAVIQLIVVLIVIGVALYLANTYIPMAPPIRAILNIVIVLVVCLWILELFGILGHMGTVPQIERR